MKKLKTNTLTLSKKKKKKFINFDIQCKQKITVKLSDLYALWHYIIHFLYILLHVTCIGNKLRYITE